MNKLLFTTFYLLCFFIFLNQNNAAAQTINTFKFEISHNEGKIPEPIQCSVYGDSLVVGIIPFGVTDFNLRASYEVSPISAEVTVEDQIQESEISVNSFEEPIKYTVSSNGNSKTYKVKLIHTGLHVIYINTDNQSVINSKETYVDADISIYPSAELNQTVQAYKARTQIRGRGNSTWGLPKKPYRLKLASKASILGMPSHKDWVLLANYSDKTLLRNYLALEMGSKMNLAYTPRVQFVELILNGVYQGNYLLTEQIKIDKNRLDIHELEEDDEDISGGYLLEVDARLDEVHWFRTRLNVPFTLKSDVTESQLDYIKNYIQATEDAIFSPQFTSVENGYAKYLNPASFIEWFWINELFKDTDARFFSSVYFYKDRGDLLNMGPIWDFDIAAGNVDYNDNNNPHGWQVKYANWISQLFEDPAFEQTAYERWNELKNEILPTLLASLSSQETLLQLSQEQNFLKWPILNQWVWPNAVVTGSYNAEVDYLKHWLETRINWIDAQVNNSTQTNFTLSSPESSKEIHTYLNDVENITFKWNRATPGSSYKLMIDTEDGDFTNPLFTSHSDFFGTDTSLTIPLHELINILESLDDIRFDVKWTVYAYLSSDDSVSADTPFTLTFVNDVTTNTTLSNTLSNVVLYPNPAQNYVRVKVPAALSDNMIIDILDLMGKKLNTYPIIGQSSELLINLDAYSKGSYIVMIKDRYGNHSSKILIVQ